MCGRYDSPSFQLTAFACIQCMSTTQYSLCLSQRLSSYMDRPIADLLFSVILAMAEIGAFSETGNSCRNYP